MAHARRLRGVSRVVCRRVAVIYITAPICQGTNS